MIRGKAAALAVATAATLSGGAPGAGLGHAGRYVARAQTAVADALAGPDFAGASRSLEAVHAVSGTYADAEVGGGALEVRWADAAGYCVEGTTFDGTVEHLVGPNGRVAHGPCPPTVG